jgi:error-prone DNA polymerase
MSVPIHVRSYFSLGRGVLSPEAICRRAREQGSAAVGLTDTDNLYGLVRFLVAARREGVRPVAGAVLTAGAGGIAAVEGAIGSAPGLARDSPRRDRAAAGPAPRAGSRTGATGRPVGPAAPSPAPGEGARELVTAYVLDRRGFGRLAGLLSRPPGAPPADPLADLERDGWEGLALACADEELLGELARRRGGRLYAKLVYGRPFDRLARAGRALGIPLCAVNDAWYVEEPEAALGDLLAAMRRLCRLEDLPAEARLGPGQRWVEEAAMERFFSAVPEALLNARRLAEEADTTGVLSERFIFPRFDGLDEEQAFRLLRARCLAGAARRYGRGGGGAAAEGEGRGAPPSSSLPPARRPAWKERLDYELAVIRAKGFSSYFLVVEDIVAQCPRTCGRGSAAASIVSYLLGITHVDPLRYNLFFERFLNMDRKDPPDIDVDFPWDEREKALRYVFARYPAHSAMVADHITFGPRSSLREPAKALGLPEEEIARLLRFHRHGAPERIPGYLLEASERIRGFPRHLGTHPGGVVITPEPITYYTQVQESPLGYPVIAWEKDATEEAGLVKIDLLGNRSLAVLRDSLALVNSGRGADLTWEGAEALEDAATRELIAAGRTLGIFYVESPATRQLLQKMRAGDYERLVIASSIIRPAANRWIQEFVKRLHGAPYTPLTPRLEETLAETYGIMVYQEDVSRVVIDAAGFSPGEADQLRKVLSKKDRQLALPDFRERFFRRGAERGVPGESLQRIWEMILSFAGYSFCKAHSASYALVSFKLAHLKRLYPLEFFASVINNGGGFYSRQTYLNEVRRLGFPILPPEVNASSLAYTVEEGALRVGLGQLKDLPQEFLERIVEDRGERGPYANLADFLRRLHPGLPEVRVLIRSGALDGIAGGLTRPQMFWLYFRAGEDLLLPPPLPPGIGDYPLRVKLLDELATLGLMISRHPLTLFRERARRLARARRFPPLVDSRAIPASRGRMVTLAGLLVTGKEVLTRTREPMIFVSFEDEYGVFETVFFPKAFRRFYPLIDGGGVFLASGRVQDDLGALSLHVEGVRSIAREQGEEDSPLAAVSGGIWAWGQPA